ncbi:acetate--CoA ligase family protein [Planotetraspora sp. GP83]|uniref:acetate--CoA ligase family protein n=1 Tax=Planotetraspora sp. GP83 TaxID=3156264 RepID=UPI0035119EEB
MSLGVFADPRSVAVIGASADPAKWGHWLARGALRGAHRRTVHLVSRSGAVVEGVASRPSLSDLPETPELAVLCVPPSSIEQVMGEGLELGVRGFLAITAGTEDARLAARVQAAGARLVGPNCLGIYDAATALELAWGNFTPGSLGIVSQSGQLGLELAGLAGEAGIGVSRFVSVGNQADVSAAEILADLASHDLTRVVVVYLESFGDGRALLGTLQTLRERGKPVVVLTVGASEASRAAARSHTGALTASSDVVEAACRAAGAILAETPAQAVDLAQMLLDGARPVGRRVAVVGDSGGQGALAADTLSRAGLEVPQLSGATVAALGRTLPEGAGARNPVDLAGAGERDLTSYATLISTLLGSGEVDAVLLTGYFGSYGQDAPSLAAAEHRVIGMLGDAGRAAGLPVVVHTMGLGNPAVTALREHGMPTYHTIDAAGRSLGLATELALRTPRPVSSPAQVMGTPPEGYLGARALLGEYGVAYPAAVAVRDRDDVLAAPLRPPYVLKAAWLEHKTEAAGVVVGLAGAAEAADALDAMTARLGAGEYALEEMDTRPHVAELIVGARRDPSFGPLVMVGAGGVNAEVYRDVAVELAPVTEEVAMDMLRRLRILPLLTGWRGRPAVSLEGAAAVVAAVSRLVAERPGIEECEINPLRVGPGGALAVDALVVSR